MLAKYQKIILFLLDLDEPKVSKLGSFYCEVVSHLDFRYILFNSLVELIQVQ